MRPTCSLHRVEYCGVLTVGHGQHAFCRCMQVSVYTLIHLPVGSFIKAFTVLTKKILRSSQQDNLCHSLSLIKCSETLKKLRFKMYMSRHNKYTRNTNDYETY